MRRAASLSTSTPFLLGPRGRKWWPTAIYPRNALPAMPTVGAGSSQCEDSPAQRLPATIPIPCLPPIWRPSVFIATRHATSLQTPESPPGALGGLSGVGRQLTACGIFRAGTRCARHRPYQERDSQARQLVEMGFSGGKARKRAAIFIPAGAKNMGGKIRIPLLFRYSVGIRTFATPYVGGTP